MSARAGLRLLRLALGAVLCLYSLQVVWAEIGAPHHSRAGAFLLLLGVAEALAAALFLLPRTFYPAGVALLATLAVAAVFHALHGQWNPLGTLAVDSAGVVAVLSGGSRR